MSRATSSARPRGAVQTPLPALSLLAALMAGIGLAGCTTPPSPVSTPSSTAPTEGAAPAAEAGGRADDVANVRLITAQTPAVRAYRKLGARHLYDKYAKRIYKGKIPPLVYAVVVTETDIDASGRVTGVYFSRTPSHAPEVSGKIAELIKDASPLPPPGRLGAHTYVDTWLWDKSG